MKCFAEWRRILSVRQCGYKIWRANYSHLSPKQLCSLIYKHSGRRALVLIWCDVIRKKQKINEIPAASSEMSFDGRSLRRLHESPHSLYFIFLETRIIGLHFACNVIDLSSQDFPVSASGTLQPFKVVQGHWCWCQSKALMRLPISP